VRSVRPAGLAILGFKSAGRIGLHHTAGTARFVYPDERTMRGSTAAFVALHMALVDKVSPAGGPECDVASIAGGIEHTEGEGWQSATQIAFLVGQHQVGRAASMAGHKGWAKERMP
jgi:hypothetical protein